MHNRWERKQEPKSLCRNSGNVPKGEQGGPGFLPVEDFKNAAISRLSALKAEYLQQLESGTGPASK